MYQYELIIQYVMNRINYVQFFLGTPEYGELDSLTYDDEKDVLLPEVHRM